MYFLDTTTAVASLHTFWSAVSGYLPGDVSVMVEAEGDEINDVDGVITGAWSADPVAIIPGGGSGGYAAPVGALFTWSTATILDGHRLKGRTYMVPISDAVMSDRGALQEAPRALLAGAALNFTVEQDASFVVWHRPFAGKPAVGGRPARPAHDGGHGLVTGSSVQAKMAVLRSRRD